MEHSQQPGEFATGSYDGQEITSSVTFSVTSSFSSSMQLSRAAAGIGATVGVVIIIGGLVGNFLVMAAIGGIPALRKPCNVFIATLALNDFLFLLMNCAIGVHVYVRRVWNLGSYLCVYTFFANAGAVTISVCHIVLITFYRYLIIVKPNAYRKMSKTWVVTLIVVLVFVFPYCMLAATQLRPENAPPSYVYGEYVRFDELYMWCVINTGQSEGSWRVIIAYLFILALVGMMYLKIYIIAKKSNRNANINSTHQTAKIRKNERNVQLARTMVIVMVIFIVTYIPWPIAYEIELKEGLPEWVGVTVTLLMWSASSVNWLVYGLMNRQFRQAYRHLLWKTHLRRVGDVSPSVSATNQVKAVSKTNVEILSAHVNTHHLQPLSVVS